jgi:hypothetical protein
MSTLWYFLRICPGVLEELWDSVKLIDFVEQVAWQIQYIYSVVAKITLFLKGGSK